MLLEKAFHWQISLSVFPSNLCSCGDESIDFFFVGFFEAALYFGILDNLLLPQ